MKHSKQRVVHSRIISNGFLFIICRAHRNDLENILPFLTAGLFYVLTNPSVWLAITLFKVAAAARIAHTIVYTIVVIPQPARVIAWFVQYAITIYFALSSIWYFI